MRIEDFSKHFNLEIQNYGDEIENFIKAVKKQRSGCLVVYDKRSHEFYLVNDKTRKCVSARYTRNKVGNAAIYVMKCKGKNALKFGKNFFEAAKDCFKSELENKAEDTLKNALLKKRKKRYLVIKHWTMKIEIF